MKFWEAALVFLVILSISGVIGGFCWPYTVNTWLVHTGNDPAIGFWHGFGMGYVPVLGQLSIPAAVVTWVLKLFLD